MLLIWIRKDPFYVLDLDPNGSSSFCRIQIRNLPRGDGSGSALDLLLWSTWIYLNNFLELLKITTSDSTKVQSQTLTPFMYPQGITELVTFV
jgi:hypothetical protein